MDEQRNTALERLDIDYFHHFRPDSNDETTEGTSSRRSSTRSNPFDIELPEDFAPRTLEWFLGPSTDPRRHLREHAQQYEERELGTISSLERLFVPRRGARGNRSNWTVGAQLPDLPFRRASLDNTIDISHFQLARPPTPPRKRSHHPERMSNKPLPPLPFPRRLVSDGNAPLFMRRLRPKSNPPEFTLSRWSDSSALYSEATEDDLADAGVEPEATNNLIQQPESAIREPDPVMNEASVTESGRDAAGPFLLVQMYQYQETQLAAISQMEATLSHPQIRQPLRDKFVDWSQQLIDIGCPFRVNLSASTRDDVKITETDAHRVVDWAIEVGTKTNAIHDQLNDFMNAADLVIGELREISSGLDFSTVSLLSMEELYHKMTDVVRKKCRSPRLHEVLLLRSFLNLYEQLLYIPYQSAKDRVKVVYDTYPYRPVSVALNIDTPLSLLKRVLDKVYIAHGEYTALTRRMRQEFFVPIENRIPGVSSRTDGYLNNVVGPSNVI